MKILLVGGGGFIGSHLGREFIARGHQVVVVDPMTKNDDATPEENHQVMLGYRKELLTGAEIIPESYKREYMEQTNPDIVIHLGALPIEKLDDPVVCRRQIAEDIPLTYEVAKDACQLDKRLVYMSSLFAYGDFDGWGVNEEHILNPKTAYGVSKATGEFIIKANLTNYAIVRTTSVYGLGDSNMRATKIFLDRAMNGKNFWVNVDAWPDFIYIKDLARGIADVALSDFREEAFHISGGKAVNLEVFGKEIIKHFPEVTYEAKKGLDDRPRRGTLDNTKARVLLGFEPEYNLEKGVAEYVELARKYKYA